MGVSLALMATTLSSCDLVYEKVRASVSVPVIHIADPTAEAIKKAGFDKIALLGTSFTCTHPFYMGRLKEKYLLTLCKRR